MFPSSTHNILAAIWDFLDSKIQKSCIDKDPYLISISKICKPEFLAHLTMFMVCCRAHTYIFG